MYQQSFNSAFILPSDQYSVKRTFASAGVIVTRWTALIANRSLSHIFGIAILMAAPMRVLFNWPGRMRSGIKYIQQLYQDNSHHEA